MCREIDSTAPVLKTIGPVPGAVGLWLACALGFDVVLGGEVEDRC
jgi:hypothetical protein